ncbi:unnamed protein product [Camellia sinensis]
MEIHPAGAIPLTRQNRSPLPPPTIAAIAGRRFTLLHKRRKRAKKETNSQEVQLLDLGGQFCDDYNSEKLLGDKHTKSQDFPSIQLDLIRAATKHFSGENKLGEGGFGPVYKGILSDGKEIAVKRLKKFWPRITRVQE